MTEFLVGAGILIGILLVIMFFGYLYAMLTMDTGFEWSSFGAFIAVIVSLGLIGWAFVWAANLLGNLVVSP